MSLTTLSVKDGAGASKTLIAAQNGSSQLAPAHVEVDADGNQVSGLRATALTTIAQVSMSAAGDLTAVAATASQTIRLYRGLLTFSEPTTLTVKSGTATSLAVFDVAGSMALDLNWEPWFVTSSGAALVLNISGTCTVKGALWYTKSA